MSRLTIRAEGDGVKAVWYGERDVFLEGEIGYAEADKLAHYEDLEEQLEKLYGGKMPLDEVVENLNRVVQNGEEKLDYARILTNAEAEKWDKWKDLEEQGRLLELPCAVGDEVFIIWGPRYRAGRSVYGINTGKFRLSDIRNLNNTVFTTREAAEAKLAEMEGAE